MKAFELRIILVEDLARLYTERRDTDRSASDGERVAYRRTRMRVSYVRLTSGVRRDEYMSLLRKAEKAKRVLYNSVAR